MGASLGGCFLSWVSSVFRGVYTEGIRFLIEVWIFSQALSSPALVNPTEENYLHRDATGTSVEGTLCKIIWVLPSLSNSTDSALLGAAAALIYRPFFLDFLTGLLATDALLVSL